MYDWAEKRIEWYQRAVAYNAFDRVLADAITRQIEQQLAAYKFTAANLVTEFGQPLSSEDECCEYLSCYGASTESPKSAVHRLIRTDDAEFPFFLPNKKQMRVYIVEKCGSLS